MSDSNAPGTTGQAAIGSIPRACDAPTPQEEPQQLARLAAERLGLAARWRHALQEAGGVGAAEFWEADEVSQIWAQAEHDEALLAMLREDEDAAENAAGAPATEFDSAELAHARERFQQRMRTTQDAAAPAPQVLEAEDAGALTVSEVVAAMERESQRASPESSEAARGTDWRRALEPVRSSREALPAHITSRAIGDFWSRLGLSVPRDVSLAFVQAARLLLMGRAAPGARLSVARSARPAGVSEEVERLVTQAPANAQSEAPAEAGEPTLPEPSEPSPDERTST